MGGLVSTAGAYKILDKHGDSREHFVLVLGSSGSGKSTLIKNMKLSNNGYSLPELLEFRQLIFKNVVESAQALILRARQLGFDYASKENYFLADDILSYVPEGELDPDIVEAIKKIWADRAIARTLRDPWGVVPFVDSARYFCSHVSRIGDPGYLPNDTDILRAHRKDSNLVQTRFPLEKFSLRMLEVTLSVERPLLMQWLKSGCVVTFCVDLPGYDILSEDKTMTRMTESLILFDDVINRRWPSYTSVILFFGKVDLFKEKLCRVPLRNHFPQYTGGENAHTAIKYIARMFTNLNRTGLNTHTRIIQLGDRQTLPLICAAIKEMSIQKTLGDTKMIA